MTSSRPCLSIEELALYAAGASDPHRAELDRHVDGCEACRASVALAVRGARPPEDDPSTQRIASGEAVAGASDPTRTSPPAAGAASTGYTAAALRDEEVRSARTMIRMGRAVGLAAIAPVPFLGGPLAVQISFVVAVAVAIAYGVVVERRIRDPRRYSERAMLALATLVVCAGLAGMMYYGIFSAAQLFPVLAIYAFSRREAVGNTLAMYLLTAIGEAVLAAIVIGGLVPDPGLFEPRVSPAFQIVGHVLIQVGFLAAFLVGLYSRRDTQAAIDGQQKAMMLAAKREALLQEARGELDRALGIGGVGRYTDHTFGAYRLGTVLGRGGMGEVYEAVHVDTDEPAAVKLLAPRELGNPRSVARFVREVRVVSGLASPHVVRVLAASDERDPVPYLVMERLHGQTLAQLLRSAPPPSMLDEMLAQVGDALEEAWDRGIVHRDLKPHNLFRAEGRGGHAWKVLDFGIAALDEHGGTLTEGRIVGTPAYMAPEQARGERVDRRADLYALAAIAYRWLTGRPVFSGDQGRATPYQIVHLMPARPSAIAELHADVDAVLVIGLAKDPAQRWAHVSELREALARAVAGTLEPQVRERAAELVARQPWAPV